MRKLGRLAEIFKISCRGNHSIGIVSYIAMVRRSEVFQVYRPVLLDVSIYRYKMQGMPINHYFNT